MRKVRRGGRHLVPSSTEGSVLLGALMLLFVLSILGLALFDTAVVDSQLALTAVDRYRALESAQAGMQRALHRLYRDLCGGDAACAAPVPSAGWADGTIDGDAFPVTTAAFAPFLAQTTSFAGPFADPRGPGFPAEEYAGTYAVELKHLTREQAKGIGLACVTNGVDPNGACADLIYARARGTFGRTLAEQNVIPPRFVQAVIQARPTGADAGSMAVLAETITGSPEIHGSLHLVPCTSATCSSLVLAAGPGVRNDYTGMTNDLQRLLPRLPQVTCPPDTACAGSDVETLHATVRIGKPSTDTGVAINIQSREASLGEAGTGSVNALTGVRGKPTMDGVYLGRGCAPTGVAPCADVVETNPGNVYADVPIRGYDIEPPAALPRLSDPTRVLGTAYSGWAACMGPGTCNQTGALTSGGFDFFIKHAHVISSGMSEDQRTALLCGADPLGPVTGSGSPCQQRNVFDILTKQNGREWTEQTPTFRLTFNCGSSGPPCYDASGVRVNGWIVSSAVPPAPYLQLEWRGPDWINYPEYTGPGGGYLGDQLSTLILYQCMTPNCSDRRVLSPGAHGVPPGGVPGTQPNDPVRPALIYVNGPLKLCAPPASTGCVDANFYYRGHLAILANGAVGDDSPGSERGSIVVEAGLRALCESTACFLPPGMVIPPTQASFPDRSLLTLYTPGNIFAFVTGTPAVVPALIGRFYAQRKFRIVRQIDVVGAATAATFDMGGQVPRFWEVKMPLTTTALPAYAPQLQPARGSPRWKVATVRWKECSGTVTSGPC
jgi:hypothetical protein